MKACIHCGCELTEANWTAAAKSNWVNKCDSCLRTEKRKYARKWRDEHRERLAINSAQYKARMRQDDPVKLRAMSAYSDSRKRALRMGWEFNLTSQFIIELMRVTTMCPYLGCELTHDGKSNTLASLDRVDSNRGYTTDNVQIISYLANLMKSHANDNELERFAVGVLTIAKKQRVTK